MLAVDCTTTWITGPDVALMPTTDQTSYAERIGTGATAVQSYHHVDSSSPHTLPLMFHTWRMVFMKHVLPRLLRPLRPAANESATTSLV